MAPSTTVAANNHITRAWHTAIEASRNVNPRINDADKHFGSNCLPTFGQQAIGNAAAYLKISLFFA